MGVDIWLLQILLDIRGGPPKGPASLRLPSSARLLARLS
jgi:hypothetical protein